MLRISKMTDYATVIMAELAMRQGERCSAAMVAESTGLEAPTVAKALKMLARSELIDSVRGVNGGYRLSESAQKVSVAAIIRAMEGPIALTECALEPGLCSRENDCHLSGNWQRIGETIENALETLSLADLTTPRPRGIPLVERPAPAGQP